jgi:hypothetical protein
MDRVERFAGVKRVNYFYGQMLSADDFRAEQAYFIAKRHRLNQAVLGYGVVGGLSVTIPANSSPPALVVGAGLAIDARGREIDVDAAVTLDIPPSTCAQRYVIVEYIERETDAVAFPTAASETMPARIEEGAVVRLSDANDDTGVAIARIVHHGSGWQVDAGFNQPRCR